MGVNMNLAMIRFIAHFADGEVAEGRPFLNADCGVQNADLNSTIRNPHSAFGTGWRDLPDKPIARLSLVNPHGDLITLQGYEEYNFMVENVQALGVASYTTNVYAMGVRNGKVTVYRVGAGLAPAQNVRAGVKPAPTNPVQVGDIMVKVADRGKEYLGAETTGWRKGMLKIRHPFGFAQGKLLGGGLKSSNV